MKNLVQARRYPIQITSARSSWVEFNMNNINWHVLNDRINIENAFSLSALFLRFPPAGEDTSSYYRTYEIKYACNTDLYIPSLPDLKMRNVEDYMSTPLTGTVKRTSDADVGFPLNTFKAIDDCTNPSNISGFMIIECNVAPYVAQGSQFWGQPYAEFLLSPDWKKPTIFDAIISQNGIVVTSIDPRQAMELTWTSSIQDEGEVQIWQGGLWTDTIPVGTARTCIIPANTIKAVGEFALKVVASNNPFEDLGTTNFLEVKGTAAVPAVAASNFKINQLEKRTPIIGTWDSTNQSDFRLEVIRNRLVEYILTGGSAKTFIIPPGTLQEGAVTFRLSVNNTFGTATTTVVLSLDKTITFSKPLITSLEPDRLNQNLDLALSITWNCANQDNYNLQLYREEELTMEFSGSRDKSITLPPRSLKSGNIKLLLTIVNVINGIMGVSTREAKFFGYGTPDAPIFEDVDIYNQALPLIKWVSTDQEYYDFKISTLDGTIHEASGEILSRVKQYQITKDLLNNTQYKLALRIKSSFGLWSAWKEKTISVKYSNLPKPKLSLLADEAGNVIVNISNPTSPQFKDCELWRKAGGYEDWVRVAKGLPANLVRNDPTVGANVDYLYKVIANGLDGGRTQGDAIGIRINFEGFYITDLQDSSRMLRLLVEDSESSSPITINTISDEVTTLFVGASKPIIEKGVVGYQTASMKFLLHVEDYKLLEDMKKKSKLLLYKDERGNKLYGNLQGNLVEEPKRWFENYVDVAFSFLENNFSETDILTGNLILSDGGWVFV